jgi:hypothetical protein
LNRICCDDLPSRPESIIAPYLTTLQQRLKPYGIQVGSYPAAVNGEGVFVSLIGRASRRLGDAQLFLSDVVRELEAGIGGRVVSEEEIAKKKEEVKHRTFV